MSAQHQRWKFTQWWVNFVQILHNGHNHWLVTSSTGSHKSSEIYIYDSMYCNTTSEVRKLVAALLFTNESHITSNLCKCNVAHKTTVFFAIAFATALCLGKQPGQLCFDQDRMCTHLLKCIESSVPPRKFL